MKYHLIPGCTYMTKNGIELLYIGFGSFWLDDGAGGAIPFSDFPNRYVYMRVKDLERFVKKGEISEDLSSFCGNGTIDWWLSIREKPRAFVSDTPVKKLFEPEFFDNWEINDNSYASGGSALWHFTAKN